MIKKLLEDNRKIISIHSNTETAFYATVGDDNITKIEVYPEKGQMAEVPWFAIYAGDEIVGRVDAMGLGVIYEPKNKE